MSKPPTPRLKYVQKDGTIRIGDDNELIADLYLNDDQEYLGTVLAAAPEQEAQLVQLRDELASLHEAVGSALALVRQGANNAAILVLRDALKGRER